MATVKVLCSITLLLGQFSKNLAGYEILLLVILWGFAVSAIFVGFQTWVLRLAHDDPFPATAVYVSFFYVAIGSGALIGAWLVSVSNIPHLLTIAGVAIALTSLLVLFIPQQAAGSEPTGEIAG